MEIKQAPAVKIKFTKSPDHTTHPVSGIWGGATPQGDILCHFFVEQLELPEVVELEFDVDSGKSVEKKKIEEKVYLREILTSLVIRPDIAKSIGTWLIRKAEAIEKSRQQNPQAVKRTIQ